MISEERKRKVTASSVRTGYSFLPSYHMRYALWSSNTGEMSRQSGWSKQLYVADTILQRTSNKILCLAWGAFTD